VKRTLVALFHRAYARMIVRQVPTPATTTGFAHVRGRQCLLVTYRSDGSPVPTPVWFGRDGERLYLRAEGGTGKLRRVRDNGRVLVAPCSFRGRVRGPAADGTARLVTEAETDVAERAIQANYGLGRRLYERWMTLPDGEYIEVVPL
jgi:uncharacterized protein